MNQMDLFDLFNENGGVLSADFSYDNTKKSSEDIISITDATATKDIDDDNSEEDGIFDDMLEEYEEEEIVVKPAAKKSKKNSSKKKSSILSGTSKATLPVICKGRNWKHIIEGFGEKSINEILQELHDAGITEVAHKDVSPISDEKALKNGIINFPSIILGIISRKYSFSIIDKNTSRTA